jgi:hypothetical protein
MILSMGDNSSADPLRPCPPPPAHIHTILYYDGNQGRLWDVAIDTINFKYR